MKKTEAIFDKYDMTEDRFWQLIEEANWPKKGYDKPKLAYLMSLKAKEGKEFRKIVEDLWNALDKFIDGRYEGMNVGDDSYSDLMYHIVGLGKDMFYKHLSSYTCIKGRANGRYGSDNGFEESFGYAVPYESEWDNVADSIKQVENSIKRREGDSAITDPDLLMVDEILDTIVESLRNADGNEVAQIYNDICHADNIEYNGDDTWRVKEAV